MEVDKRVQLFNPTWKQIYLKFESEKTKLDTYHECIGFDFSFNPQTAHCMSASSTLFELHKAAAMYFWYHRAEPTDKSIKGYFSEYNNCIDKNHPYFNSNYGIYAYRHKLLRRCIERLKNNPLSRQAMFCINNNDAMSDMSIDKLCTNAIHFFIRNGKLQMVVQMRSSNFVTLLPYDAFMFSVFYMEVFNELVKHYFWLDIGEIKMQIASLHYYSHNWSSIGNSQLLDKPIIIDFAEHNCINDLENKLVSALAKFEYGQQDNNSSQPETKEHTETL